MRPFFRPALLVFIAALAARLTAQPANVQADPTTGVLFRPSAATFISGNGLATATGGIVLGANGGTGVANTGKTLTLGGNVTTSGAFGLTLTLTAATGVTLPTTGTLATLAGSETLTNKTLTSPTLTTPTLGAATATSLTLSGNISSSAWTTNGVRLKGVAATLTDTTSTGTVTAAYTDVLGGNTIAANNATTFTDYITAFFKEPTAGSLVTMTNKWALGGESLRIGTSTPMSVSTAGAITANSLTGRASTDLTLTGGSTGASLVLGQGASANVVLTPQTSGAVQINPAGTRAPILDYYRGGVVKWEAYVDASDVYTLRDAVNGVNVATLNQGALSAATLKIVPTTASTSTTSGALQVAGGVGVSGAGYFGGAGVSGALGALNVSPSAFTGTGQIAVVIQPVASSSATSNIRGVYTKLSTAAAAFTVNTAYGYHIDTPTIGAASAINTITGVLVSNQGASGIANAYGIDIEAQSGAATTNIGLRNAGITSLTNSTPSTGSTSGALQVAGGIYAGAASVFGSTVTIANAAGGVNAQESITNSQSSQYSILRLSNTGGTAQAYELTVAGSTAANPGMFYVYDSTAGAVRMSIAPTTGAATFAGGALTLAPAAAEATITAKGRATGTNPLATTSRGGVLALTNLDTTDNNAEAITFQNSNDLAIASIVAQNVSHTGRTGKLYFNVSNGAAPAEAFSIAPTLAATFASAVTMNGALTFSNGTPRVSTNDGALLMESSSGNNQGILYISPSGTATNSKIQMYGAVSSSTNYVRHEFSQTGSNTIFNQQSIGTGTLGTTAFQFNGSPALTLTGSTLAATFAGAVTIAGTVIHTLSATPASASATGTVGTMSWDANYIYICTATNTWKRVAIATW